MDVHRLERDAGFNLLPAAFNLFMAPRTKVGCDGSHLGPDPTAPRPSEAYRLQRTQRTLSWLPTALTFESPS